MARNYKELQTKMDPASREDNCRLVREDSNGWRSKSYATRNISPKQIWRKC